ncbi:dTDP-glucose 4,6-dehydratase [Spirochaeta lutea]|uniref:dTDP-glucose 4,6-dehydratase n=1 Tax=Spirochaeta lutea TaxID=1480694 RepID=A0A098QUN8_9SPIO|nr:dTDP-glucose 4,6-dehydratase [Spirochaeta lutea]KGE71118.1 dTDP-glucose 4,6-dehydratase [Spirochaeta lutea]
MRQYNSVLVTGGAGFIGSNFIRYMLSPASGFTGRIINLDSLTYAGNLLSLKDVADQHSGSRYIFEHGDICDADNNRRILEAYQVDVVVHLAAESHVDRSIHGPGAFVQTNVVGTFSLLEACRTYWQDRKDVLFHHVSTDEVYGSLGEEGYFTEGTPYDPRSPYSASKAGSDHLVMAYHHTYGLPVTLTNCSNNYGPYQFPEKLIPVMIFNMLENKPLPVYGDGTNIRDWLYVEDHNSAVWLVMQKGQIGRGYNIGGDNEWQNIELVRELCAIVARRVGIPLEKLHSLISYVTDRPGHDRRYAIDCSKLKTELGWRQSVTFAQGLERTVDWYIENQEWSQAVRTGEYREWMKAQYS